MWFIITERKKKETHVNYGFLFIAKKKKKNSTSQCVVNLNTQQDCVTIILIDMSQDHANLL